MRILVFGAGNIGSLYAAKLRESGQDVTLLARGRRLEQLRERGIVLQDVASGERSSTPVKVTSTFDSEAAYDLVAVVLPKDRVREALPTLARNHRIKSFLFMCNNAEGPQMMIEALGREKVLLGFPGAAAVEDGEVIRYLITSAREQPTTIGELDGRRSQRIERIGQALQRAGFPTAICSNMDAWLKTHVAEISPTANALYMAGSDRRLLAEDREILRLMLRAIREGYRVLRSLGIPVTPAAHRVFEWLPEPVLLWLMSRMIASDDAAVKIGHAHRARAEMKLLADEFKALARRADVPTPAIDRLYTFVEAAGESANQYAEACSPALLER